MPPPAEPPTEVFASEAEDHSGQSNLALAFLVLPKAKRRDMDVFYTFCRVVDDIADSPALPLATKQQYLDAWKRNLTKPESEPQPHRLGMQMRALMRRYQLPVEHLLEIIAGVEMDLAPVRYADWDELRRYCYRVASVVGLVSIEIFGYRHADCRIYAEELGLALQTTNILRDVARDYSNGGRIYLPQDEMERFGVTEEHLRTGREDEAVRALARFQAERSENFYRRALAALPAEDRRSMVAAEIMRTVYHRILERIEDDGYRILSQDYRLGKLTKLWLVLRAWSTNRWS
ncbi:MAG: presqualene diphosphate synthase HpnD [Verrucomicrobia bacterium]|nr:presqualene diphosphate synthase HpnD [Verrucomicrobiota bacterium]